VYGFREVGSWGEGLVEECVNLVVSFVRECGVGWRSVGVGRERGCGGVGIVWEGEWSCEEGGGGVVC